jgi:TorA maturation chaperone TorD
MPTADALMARATLWRWIGRAFWYPDEVFLAEWRSPAARRELQAAARGTGSGTVARALADVLQAADEVAGAGPGLAEEHTYLFARQVKVPPHETRYAARPYGDRSQERSEVSGFYAAFGFQTSAGRPELPDHVSVEAEFTAVLLAKEVYAAAQGWQEQAEVARDARAAFVSEHLAAWLPAFAERLALHARLGFYPAVGRLAVALVALETTR